MYPSSLSNAQWNILQPHMPKPSHRGRPRQYSYRLIFDAIFYINRAGCAWNMMPNDLPPWNTVYYYFRKFKLSGFLQQICAILRRLARRQVGRTPEPTAAIIDSQSTKSIDQPGVRGYDANKKVKGRKRHIIVDVEGFLLVAFSHEANIVDCVGAREVLLRLVEAGFMDVELIWADQGYRGQLVRWAERALGLELEISKKSTFKGGFHIQPRRWVVERTFGWFGKYRRLAKEYEQLPSSSEAMMYLAMTHIFLKRLTP